MLSLPQVSLPPPTRESPHGAYGEACLGQQVSSSRKLAFDRQTELNLSTREGGRGGSWLNPGYRDHGNGVVKRRGDALLDVMGREGRLATVPSCPEQEAFSSRLVLSCCFRGLSIGFTHSHRSKCGLSPPPLSCRPTPF